MDNRITKCALKYTSRGWKSLAYSRKRWIYQWC